MSTNLIQLYNSHVDFVRKHGDYDYRAVEWPKFATHRLVATRWNKKEEFRPNSKGKIVQPDGYALSVCATPIRINFKRTTLKIKHRFPKGRFAPIYYAKGTLESKKKVLRQYVMLMGVPKRYLRAIKFFDEEDCDTFYRNLIRASRLKYSRYNAKNAIPSTNGTTDES